MTIFKKPISHKTSVMLARMAKAELDNGLDELVLNLGRVKKKQAKITPKKIKIVRPYKSLDEHYDKIKNCQKCALGKTRTKFVYGVGNPDADIIFVGEAPGRDEDLQGIPFVGRAGKLLDKILAAIDFTRDDIYIANMLKCRPPENRDPKPDEMEICRPYLEDQIKMMDPKIICALGRVSGQTMLQTTTPLGRLRGRWHNYDGRYFMVTYHPAALLRNPAYKKDTWEDVQMLRAKYDELTAGKYLIDE